MISKLKEKTKKALSSLIHHRYTVNTFLALFFVSYIPLMPIILISDEIINLINFAFKKNYKTLIKQSSKIRTLPTIKETFKKFSALLISSLLLATVSLYFALLSFLIAKDPRHYHQERELLKTAKDFSFIGAIFLSVPVITHLGIIISTPIRNLIDQINIKSSFASFEHLTYGISSYSFIDKLKNYFFFDPLKKELESQDSSNIVKAFNKLSTNLFRDGLLSEINTDFLNDSFFESFSNISNDCLSPILDSEQSSLESYFLAAKLIKNNGLESSNNPFLDNLLSILEKKPTICHKTTKEKLTRIFSKRLFDHLLLNASASNPQECGKSFFLNCLYLNKIFSIDHVKSSYAYSRTIGDLRYCQSIEITRPLSLSELQGGLLETMRNNSVSYPFFRGDIPVSERHRFKININSNEYFFEFSSEDEVIHLSNILLMNSELQKYAKIFDFFDTLKGKTIDILRKAQLNDSENKITRLEEIYVDELNANLETFSNIIKKGIFLHLHADKYPSASVEQRAIVEELFKLWNRFYKDLKNLITNPQGSNRINDSASIWDQTLDLAAVSKAALGAASEAAKLPQRATLILSRGQNTANGDPTPYSSFDID